MRATAVCDEAMRAEETGGTRASTYKVHVARDIRVVQRAMQRGRRTDKQDSKRGGGGTKCRRTYLRGHATAFTYFLPTLRFLAPVDTGVAGAAALRRRFLFAE